MFVVTILTFMSADGGGQLCTFKGSRFLYPKTNATFTVGENVYCANLATLKALPFSKLLINSYIIHEH